jgi:hypothetical protein
MIILVESPGQREVPTKFKLKKCEAEAVDCTTLINPTNRTIAFDVGRQAIPETIILNLVLSLVNTRFQLSSSRSSSQTQVVRMDS